MEISGNPGFENLPKVTVNSLSYLNETPLHVAAILGNTEAIKNLVEAGADINFPESYGYTALHLAAEQGHQAAYDLLVSLGADTMLKTRDGSTVDELRQFNRKRKQKK